MPVSVVITREVSSVTTVSFKAHPVLHLMDIILCMLLELESWISITTQLQEEVDMETTNAMYIANGGLISMKNNSIANIDSGYALQVSRWILYL